MKYIPLVIVILGITLIAVGVVVHNNISHNNYKWEILTDRRNYYTNDFDHVGYGCINFISSTNDGVMVCGSYTVTSIKEKK